MGAQSSIEYKMTFEDIQRKIEKPGSCIIINTLPTDMQTCIIPTTVNCNDEERIINELLNSNNETEIVIYGINNNDESCMKKYFQLQKLGFTKIYIYIGGMFEWMMLQDIYGPELFPTTSQELDIMRYKPAPASLLNVR